jgi:hypothetical protein
MVIHLGPLLPEASCGLPESLQAGRLLNSPKAFALPYLALLRMGFTKLPRSPGILVSSYLTVSPLPRTAGARGGLFSVALSLGSPPVAVSDHPALWSPDFPLQPGRGCTAATILSAPVTLQVCIVNGFYRDVNTRAILFDF